MMIRGGTVSGFTLIELMVVMCLVMILASCAFMDISFLDSTVAHAEVDKLYNVFQYLRQSAITTDTEIVLVCDVQNNSYTYNNQTEKLSKKISFGCVSGIKGPPGGPTAFITSPITFPSRMIHFYPTGIISSGTIYLVDTKKKMYALSNAVSPVSHVRCYSYDGAWKIYD